MKLKRNNMKKIFTVFVFVSLFALSLPVTKAITYSEIVSGQTGGRVLDASTSAVPYTEVKTGAGVFVFPPASSASGPGKVLLPDGTNMDVSASQTAGLQEAIDYSRDYGWDLFIYGRGAYSEHGIYHLSKGLRFNALQGKTVRIVDATFDFGNLSSEPALTFDSTMMVDFRMTGAILAPSASPALLFKPVTPHPLDGTLFGTKGVVASRFHFDTIKANQLGVFFDTSAADVNNNSFYFGNITVAGGGVKISQTGGRFSQNIRDQEDIAKAGMPNNPDSLDYFRPKGVVVLPPQGSIGSVATVLTPGGATLDTSGTKTSGVQEAINYAVSNNLDLVVYGRGLQVKNISFSNGQANYPNNGFYQMLQGLVFPAMNNKTIRIYNVTFNYGVSGIDSAITFNGANSVDFELTGQVVSIASGTGIRFYPGSSQPITNSRFRIGSVGPGENIGILFDLSAGSISNNKFFITEVLKDNYNLLVAIPAANSLFSQNYVRVLTAHQINSIGLQIGQNSANAANISNNQFVAFLDPDNGNPDVGVQVWGKNNQVLASVRASFGVRTGRGISLEPSSSGNNITYSELLASTPVFQSVAGANTYLQNSGQLFVGTDTGSFASAPAFVPPSPAPSPSPAPTPTPTPSPTPALTPTPTPSPTTSPTPVGLTMPLTQTPGIRRIIVHARSSYSSGYAHMQLRLGETLMQEWNISGSYKDYIHDTERDLASANLRIYFTNDYYNRTTRADRNLFVDYITVDGVRYLSTDPSVYSTGTWQAGSGCVAGYRQSIELDCNGYLEYTIH